MDAAFLYAETGDAPLHVMGALVLESYGRGPREDFRRLRAQIERRLPSLPLLRRKLVEVPLALGHPVWSDDPDFDLDAHLQRAALPAPGGERELAELIARIAERPLRRDRPLWEMWVIEGVQRGCFALVVKIHHAAVDGIGGALLMLGLLDVEREASRPRAAQDPPAGDPLPTPAQLFADATSALAQPMHGARQVWRAAAASARIAYAAAANRGLPLPSAPRTLLNGRVTSRRAIALGSVSLEAVKRVKNSYAATVNHVVLAACAGALRRYLGAHGAIPREPLVAGVPMAIGARPADGLGNALSAMLVQLPVQLSDPRERLRAARESSRQALDLHDQLGNQVGEWADLVPSALLSTAVSAYSRLGLAQHHPPLVNLVMSNVPGPDVPLYCAGSRVKACHPIGPIYAGCALNLTVMSYDGVLAIGAIGCPDAVPDLDDIPRAFEESVAELVAIVDGNHQIAAAS